jgi:SAM-dependent methyltransferase
LAFAGAMLTPAYCLIAFFQQVPGLHLRWKSFYFALKLLFHEPKFSVFKAIFLMIFFPLDSTRYFEIDFVGNRLNTMVRGNYLDVSSPRLLFMLYLSAHASQTADLINPDKADLYETEKLLRSAGLLNRCRLHECVIADAPLTVASYEVITCTSVLEHIPEAKQAVEKMWRLLKPGGRLLLTVPCAAEAEEQFIDRDEYGVIGKNENGVTFWQRFYDATWLQEHIFSVTGLPHEMLIFGETTKGVFQASAREKRSNRLYPFWREPYCVGRNYRFFDTLQELPGEGVIGMEFIKP